MTGNPEGSGDILRLGHVLLQAAYSLDLVVLVLGRAFFLAGLAALVTAPRVVPVRAFSALTASGSPRLARDRGIVEGRVQDP